MTPTRPIAAPTATRVVPAAVLAALLVGAGCQEYGLEGIDHVDTFIQGDDTERVVDVLWVVDNSGTMSEEQGALLGGLGGVMELFGNTVADFRLGVITTDVEDPDQRGRLQGDPPVLDPATPSLTATFIGNATVGVNGSRDERGFEALELALTEAVDAGANDGFFRDGAALEVVVVSDEDDHSDGGVEDLLSGLMVHVPDSQAFKVHAIVGDVPSGCLSSQAAADAGTRYLEAARRTEGYTGSICLDDWTELLYRIGLSALGLQDAFVLTMEPDPATIAVTVDDEAVAEDEADGWTYDPGTNAVVFHGDALPQPGARIVVEYDLK